MFFLLYSEKSEQANREHINFILYTTEILITKTLSRNFDFVDIWKKVY